jgi:hypothetical protein
MYIRRGRRSWVTVKKKGGLLTDYNNIKLSKLQLMGAFLLEG